jgi:hypothetical protein
MLSLPASPRAPSVPFSLKSSASHLSAPVCPRQKNRREAEGIPPKRTAYATFAPGRRINFWVEAEKAAGSPGWRDSPAPVASRGNRENLRPCRNAVCVASRWLRREQQPRRGTARCLLTLKGCREETGGMAHQGRIWPRAGGIFPQNAGTRPLHQAYRSCRGSQGVQNACADIAGNADPGHAAVRGRLPRLRR